MTALPKPDARPKALHVLLPVSTTAKVLSLAEKRREHAQTMIAALLDHLVASGGAEAMLDDIPPPPGHGWHWRAGVKLTATQSAVLTLIGQNRDRFGVCRLGADAIACLLGKRPSGTVNSVLKALDDKGLIARHTREPNGGAVIAWVLTERGDVACRLLAEGE